MAFSATSASLEATRDRRFAPADTALGRSNSKGTRSGGPRRFTTSIRIRSTPPAQREPKRRRARPFGNRRAYDHEGKTIVVVRRELQATNALRT